MTCDECGARCQGSRCLKCERIAAAEAQNADFEYYECPTCGGRTSGQDVECYRCRGDGE